MSAIGNFMLGFGMFAQAIVSLLIWLRQTKQAGVMRELEINTNSMKDALIKVTGESEHAKGVIQGKRDAKESER